MLAVFCFYISLLLSGWPQRHLAQDSREEEARLVPRISPRPLQIPKGVSIGISIGPRAPYVQIQKKNIGESYRFQKWITVITGEPCRL